MKLIVLGPQKQDVTLTDKDFITEGGEGRIYGKGNTIYKLYTDPKKMIPLSKIQELQAISRNNVLNPQAVLANEKGQPVGFTMPWIKDTVPLVKLFTNDFRNRFGIDQKLVTDLVLRIASDIRYIHSCDCLLVDGNEMNYLIDSKDFKTPFFIDVDSWQTRSFPATAIMMSIRDFHNAVFSDKTDWFSFAVITCQLFLGIHPYKGTHDGFKKSDMEGRMKANVSIFNKDVRLPGTVRSMDTIPSDIRTWLYEVLEKGRRLAPPEKAGAIFAALHQAVAQAVATQFDIALFREFPITGSIVRYNDGCVTLADRIITNEGTFPIENASVELIHSIPYANPVKVWIAGGLLSMNDARTNKSLLTMGQQILAEDKMVVGKSVYVKVGDRLTEFNVKDLGSNTVTTVGQSYNVMPHSTKLFNGVIYQDILGKPWFMIPYPAPNGSMLMMQKCIPELQGCSVLEVKHDNHVVVCVVGKNARYDELWFKFNEDYSAYECIVWPDVSYHVPNFIVLDNGVGISISDDDEVRVFFKDPKKDSIQVYKDPTVTFDMKLCKNGMQVMLRAGAKLFTFKMRKP